MPKSMLVLNSDTKLYRDLFDVVLKHMQTHQDTLESEEAAKENLIIAATLLYVGGVVCRCCHNNADVSIAFMDSLYQQLRDVVKDLKLSSDGSLKDAADKETVH